MEGCINSPSPHLCWAFHTLSSLILTMALGASVKVPIFQMRTLSVRDDMTSPSRQLFSDRARFIRPVWLQSR